MLPDLNETTLRVPTIELTVKLMPYCVLFLTKTEQRVEYILNDKIKINLDINLG